MENKIDLLINTLDGTSGSGYGSALNFSLGYLENQAKEDIANGSETMYSAMDVSRLILAILAAE